MYENHHMIFLPYGRNSVAYYSYKAPETLIVFVHGFAGHAMRTWDEFPVYLRNYSDFSRCDIIFYGYDSLKLQANANADLFYKAMQDLHVPPERYNLSEKPIVSKNYTKILFMAHSLGAIVVRRALLSANVDEATWLASSMMLLFAPAHRGAYPQQLAFECLPGLFKVLGSVAKFAYPVLNDLDKNSPTICDLIHDSQQLLDAGKGNFVKAAAVVTAAGDNIVVYGRFCNDPNNTTIENKTHSTVCKPVIDKYESPLEVLLKVLSNKYE